MNERASSRAQSPAIPLTPQSDSLDKYLACDEIIDWQTPEVAALARSLTSAAGSEVEKAKCLYEWVRDQIPHSCDVGHTTVTCRASDVLRHRTGTCLAKAHLLAAMLRAIDIPAGLCYQLLWYNDGDSERMILHGLNGVYLRSIGRWIRVDPRGNKSGVDAQFRTDCEQLAFPVDSTLGELLHPTVFAAPLASVVECLSTFATVSEALKHLPESIDAKQPEGVRDGRSGQPGA